MKGERKVQAHTISTASKLKVLVKGAARKSHRTVARQAMAHKTVRLNVLSYGRLLWTIMSSWDRRPFLVSDRIFWIAYRSSWIDDRGWMIVDRRSWIDGE